MEGIEAKTGVTPPALQSRPTLSQFEQPFYDAFQTLSSSRQWTQAGPAAIPVSEILAYFQMYGISDIDDRDDFMILIRRLDAEFLEKTLKKG